MSKNNKKLYLAKPFDGINTFFEDESRFIHSMNVPTPQVHFLSLNKDFNYSYERIPEGMPQYFYYNGIDIEYVYPLDKEVVGKEIDFSIPILQPFTYTRFQKSLLDFDKIIFTDKSLTDNIIRKYGLAMFKEKFHFLQRSKQKQSFMEYDNNYRRDINNYTKYHSLANKLITAVKMNNFSDLKYK